MSVYITPRSRAIDIWRAIQGNPFTVTFKNTSGVPLSSQTIRLEYDRAAQSATSEAGTGSERPLILFGVRGHPTQADSDIKAGYRFTYSNREYRVTDVILLPGEIQARTEAV